MPSLIYPFFLISIISQTYVYFKNLVQQEDELTELFLYLMPES